MPTLGWTKPARAARATWRARFQDELGRMVADVNRMIDSLHAAGGAFAEMRKGLHELIQQVQQTAATAVGGETIGQKIDGLARYPINVRFPRETRDSMNG